MPFTSRIAALHHALWSIDRGYRLWWYIWPASIALLICGWISIEKPAGSSVPWGRSSSAPAQPANSSRPADEWPDTLRNDAITCLQRYTSVQPDPSIKACGRIIDSGLVDGNRLANVRAQRGLYYLDLQQPDQALADLNAALKLQPNLPDALTNRGWIYLKREQFDTALNDLNQAIGFYAPDKAARARFFRGYTLFKLNRYAEATTDLNETQRLEPKNPNPYLWRGDVEYAQQNYDAALKDYDEFSNRVPTDARGMIGRGMVLEATSRPQEALAAYESVLKLDAKNDRAMAARDRLRSLAKPANPKNWPEKLQDDAAACINDALGPVSQNEACSRMIESGLLNEGQLVAAYNLRGFNYAATQPDRALADLDAALKIRPDNAESLAYRGRVYTAQHRFDAALQDLNKAMERSVPEQVSQIRTYRGRLFLELKDYGKALADLNEAQKLDPENIQTYLARGEVEYAQQRYDDALRDFDEVTKRFPGNRYGLMGRGLALEAAGRPKEALLAYEKILALDPTNARVRAARDRLQPAAGHADVDTWPETLRDEAAACSNGALGFAPRNQACSRMIQSGLLNDRQLVKAYTLRGDNYMATDPNQALTDLNAALKIQPDNSEALNSRGLVNFGLGRFDAALQDLNKALEHCTPREVALIRLLRADVFFRLQDYVKAMADVSEVEKLNPGEPGIYLSRGQIEYAQQRYDDAVRDFDEYTRRVPKSPYGWIALAAALEAAGRPSQALLAYEQIVTLDPTNSKALAARDRLRLAQKSGKH